MTPRPPRLAVKLLVFCLALGGTVLFVPGHALARCFGVPPEPTVFGPGWYANLSILDADGARDWAEFGALQGAPDYLNRLDQPELNVTNRSVVLAFEVFAVGGPRGKGPAESLVNVSIDDANDTVTAWLLVILYRGVGVQWFRLSWNASEISAVPGDWTLTVETPGQAPVDMRSVVQQVFLLSPGTFTSWIVGVHTPATPSVGPSAQTLVIAGTLYAIMVALVLALRARRRRAESARTPPAVEEPPSEREKGGRT